MCSARTGYDIVVPSASYVQIWVEEGLLLESNPNQMENFKNVDERWVDETNDRSNALLRLANAIEARVDEINAVECKDTGKPLGLTMAEEMPYASDHFKFFAGAARVLGGSSAGLVVGRRGVVGLLGHAAGAALRPSDFIRAFCLLELQG